MMKSKILTSLKGLFILLCMLIAILACSDQIDTAQGGATTESTNGVVLLKAYTFLDSSEANHSHLKIFKAEVHPDSADLLIYEGRFDARGNIRFTTPEDGDYYLEAYSDGIGRRIAQSFKQGQDYNLEEIYLDSTSSINGDVKLIEGATTKVYLPGSDQVAQTDNQGKYQFDEVSPGTYEVNFESLTQNFEITPMALDTVNLGTSDAFEDNYDRELLLEIITKNTDTVIEIDDIASFEFIGSQERVTHIDLSGLGIAPEEMDGTGIPRMSNLQPIEVDMSDNGLYKIPQNWGWKWDRIERLDLSNNQIVQIPSSFKDIKTMKVLDLRNNKMKTIRDDVNLMVLDSIYVGNNHLVDEPIEIQDWLDLYAEDNWRELQTDP